MSDQTLKDALRLRDAGFAIHYLCPRSKAPISDNWSEAPVASLEKLRATYRQGYNLGVRLGEHSAVGGGYLHVIDLDIRMPDLADEAWVRLEELFPGVDVHALPCVQSGSGGESRHLYFVTEKPFRSKRLAVSDDKFRRVKDGKEGWSYTWEIELFGTGKQVACPPSIHPDTGKPYVWLRPFDFDAIELGLDDWPRIPAAAIEALQVAEHSIYEFESREPLTFKKGQLERTLAAIPVSDLHYDDWIRLGQAIHHQTGGSKEGLDLWIEHTKRSAKFTGDKQLREMRRIKWRSFGKYRGKPVTMATIVAWSNDARVAALAAEFDDLDDAFGETPTVTDDIDFDDLLGGDEPSTPKSDLDLLGGDDDDDSGSELAPAGDWVSLFDLAENGAIKPTLTNVELVLKNDTRLAGLAQLNEFTQETVQRTAPGTKPNRRRNPAKPTKQLEGRVWRVNDTLNGELWSDDRDFAIRTMIEAPKTQGGYGFKVSDRDLKAAVVLAANDNAFHPVREYLDEVAWDGTPRVDTLFVDYLGSPDDAYCREVARIMMVAAVTRIFEPGHKFDFAVILEGLQGKRKSTFIKTLGRNWFGELNADWSDSKQLIELMQGKWILEIPELSGFGRADVRSLKAFISTEKDRARLAYARRAGEFPRQCIFIGSTNDREYLKDDTGGRRFWPMTCEVPWIDIAALEANIDQLWAEAVAVYRAMREAQPFGTLPLYLRDDAAMEVAAQLQESRRQETVEDGLAGQIAAWLDTPIQSGDLDDETGAQRRLDTCLREVWVECLHSQLSAYDSRAAQMLGRTITKIPGWSATGQYANFPDYGRQRVYSRGGADARHGRTLKLAS